MIRDSGLLLGHPVNGVGVLRRHICSVIRVLQPLRCAGRWNAVAQGLRGP